MIKLIKCIFCRISDICQHEQSSPDLEYRVPTTRQLLDLWCVSLISTCIRSPLFASSKAVPVTNSIYCRYSKILPIYAGNLLWSSVQLICDCLMHDHFCHSFTASLMNLSLRYQFCQLLNSHFIFPCTRYHVSYDLWLSVVCVCIIYALLSTGWGPDPCDGDEHQRAMGRGTE